MIQIKGALVLGALVGATASLLLAPEKGSITRDRLKKEGKAIKDQITTDFAEVKADVSEAATFGKTKLKEELKDLASKASCKTEEVITFLEHQLSVLKAKNKALQKTT